MDKYKGIILLSDMDGTLLNSESKVSEENKEAINDFIKEGGRFGIATGRSLTNAAAFLDGVNLNGYCILANGGLLFDSEKKEYLEECGLEKERVEKFLRRCIKEKPRIGVQIYGKDMCHFISPEEYADPCVIQDHLPVKFDSLDDIAGFEWIKVLFSGSEEEIEWLKRETEYLELQGVVDRVRSAIAYYEFLPLRINKGTMLTRMRRYAESTDVIYAVGDYFNDINMIKQADVGIAVENAPASVREWADKICTHCDSSAVADIIRNIIPCNQSAKQ